MEAYHIILAVITGVYLLLCSWWDLKDRMIYTFPCMMLTGLWVGFSVMKGVVEPKILLAYIVLFSVLYITFVLTKAWGGGDSDLLLLFGAVYLAQISGSFSLYDISKQCIAIAVVLVIAAIVGIVEAITSTTAIAIHCLLMSYSEKLPLICAKYTAPNKRSKSLSPPPHALVNTKVI